jgi:hypothetical protein
MSEARISRRLFIRDTAATAAGVTVGSTIATAWAATDLPAEVKRTRSYHPDMEYRRLGKTDLWVSAVCLGGHWKRIDKVIPADGPLDAYNAPGEELMGPFMQTP